MDCIDKIIDFYDDPNHTSLSTYLWSIKYIAELTNKNVINFNFTQFKDCLILILNLLWVESNDENYKKGTKFNNLNDSEKKILNKLLKSEFNS